MVGNPRYISEIIKEFIVRGKERFPNLFTYQSDWLAHIDEFGLNPTYSVSYTGQSIYAPNTLERPVKSAILKGNTGYRDIDTGEFLETFEEGRNLELVSVKMPVLTTYGVKNIFTGSINQGVISKNGTFSNNDTGCYTDIIEVIPNTKCVISNNLNLPYDRFAFYDINGNFMSRSDSYYSLELYEFTVPNNVYFIRITLYNGGKTLKKDAFTYFEVKTIDKTNILSTPSDLELRGIGDVQDTLDCLTGEVTERIGEVVLDENNSTNFIINGISDNTVSFWCRHNASSPFVNISREDDLQTLLCDKIAKKTDFNEDVELIHSGTSAFVLRVLKNKLQTQDINGLTLYLQSNPITVQYKLATESVKTVDLTILDQNGQNVQQLLSFNGGTYFNTICSEGSPLPMVSVCVETDLEETLMMCPLEGYTM